MSPICKNKDVDYDSRITIYQVIILVMIIFAGCTDGSLKTSVKRLTMVSSPITHYKDQACKVPASLSEMRKNITNFQNSLKMELEKKLQTLSAMIDQLMQDQAYCIMDKEKQLLSGKNCSTQMSKKYLTATEDVKIPLCQSEKCKEISSRMLHTIDHSTNPCEDFYQYACGGMENDPHLDPINPYLEAVNRIQEKLETSEEQNAGMGLARTFYETCQKWHSTTGSSKSVSYAKNVVRRLGWFLPSAMVGKSFEEDFSHLPQLMNLTFYLATFMKSDFSPFFDISIEPDLSSKKHFVPRINVALNSLDLSKDIDHVTCIETYKENVKKLGRIGKSIDLNQEYKKYIECKKQGLGLATRLQRMSESVSSLGLMDFISNRTSRDELMADTRFSTENLLIDCAKILPPVINLKASLLNKDYAVLMIKDLKSELSVQIEWEQFFNTLTDQIISEDQKIHVYHKKEITDVLAILAKEWSRNKAAVHNSLLMLWTDRVYSSLVKPLQAQSNYCLQSTLKLFPDISSMLYLHSFPDAQLIRLQRYVNTMVSSFQEHMESIISLQGDYYSEDFKKKIRILNMNIGAVNDATSMNNTLTDNLKGIIISKEHSENVDNLLIRQRRLLYSLINEDTESPSAMWMQGILPFSQTGYSSHELNKIYLPYGTFFPPYFYYRQGLPEYIAYGGLGYQTALQMMTLLDETGSKHNGESKTAITVPRSSILSSECFVDQLSYDFRLYDKGIEGKYKLPNNYLLNDLLANSWATRLGWLVYHVNVYDSKASSKNLTDSPEEHLIWLGSTPLKPIKAYFLRIAQAQCSKSSEFDLLGLMEDEHVSPRIRINLIMKNENLFAEAFQCPNDSPMSSSYRCPFIFEHIPAP